MIHRKKILIVEDDERMSDLLEEFSADMGFEARVLKDGGQVVEVAGAWEPDLVTLDLALPGLTGWEVVSALRSQPQTAHLPVVVISCWADVAEVRSLDVQGVFKKPVDFHGLFTRLALLMDDFGPRVVSPAA